MKNLIYTICDETYHPLLPIWFNAIRKYSSEDVLVIHPKSFSINVPCLEFIDPSFCYRYDSKYNITEWDLFDNYDNFLYLDLDAICVGDFSAIFEEANNNPDFLHGACEDLSLHNGRDYHVIEEYRHLIRDDHKAYNAGQFAFNKKFLYRIQEYKEFYKPQKQKSNCDQPLFNMFFSINNLIKSTLSEYVSLHACSVNKYEENHYKIIHYLGFFGAIQIKLDKIKNEHKI
jgi:hypothetical protein